jgi:peptidoglycan/LPS O-acetylase OafA/YrhL
MSKISNMDSSRAARGALMRWCIAISIGLLASCGFLMTFAKATVQVKIESSSARDPLSSGNQISLSLPGRLLDSADVVGWTRTDGDLSFLANTDAPAARLSWKGDISNHDAITLKGLPNGGAVDLIVDGKTTRMDLYDPFGKTFYVRVLSLAPWRSAINVDNAVASLGVFLAATFVSLIVLKFAVPIASPAENARGPLADTAYLSRLDHLRFGAATVVLLYHFFHDYVSAGFHSLNPLFALVGDGHTGVALFMVLSGFIFAHIGHNKEIDYRKFMLARVVRIFPLYIFAILIAVSTKRWEFKPIDIILLALPVVDFYSLVALPFFGQLWTIGVEFQFYAVFPFLNRFANTRGPRYLIGLLSLLILIKGCYFNLYGDARDFGYWSILGRMDQFLIGMLAAIAFKKRARTIGLEWAFPVALALALGALTAFNMHGGYAGTARSAIWVVWPAIEAALWAMVTLTYLCWKVRVPALLDDLLAKAGALSFSMYVMQYVALPQIQRYIGVVPFTGDWASNVLLSGICFGVPGVLLLSCLTYSLIERPFFSYKFRYVTTPDANLQPRTSSVLPVSIRKEA